MGAINTPTITIIVTMNAVTSKSNNALIKLNKFFLIKFETDTLTYIDVAIDNKQVTNH